MTSDHLIVQVDGGYIKSSDKNSKAFEALVSSIYKVDDHIAGGFSKNGIRKSGTILNKIYSASTIKDRCKTIKAMTITVAKKQGMTKKTRITGLSDGASNCWNTIKTLEKYCSSIECVLDWYHIKMKFDQLINQLETSYADIAESLKWKIWHGKSQETVDRLGQLYIELILLQKSGQTKLRRFLIFPIGLVIYIVVSSASFFDYKMYKYN